MPSGVKLNVEKNGEWRPAEPRDVRNILFGIPDSELLTKIGGLHFIKEWYCAVLCLAKVRLRPGEEKDSHMYYDGRHEVEVKAYEFPPDKDKFMADLFGLSLTHRILAVDEGLGTIYVEESEDGSTNITEEVMDALAKKLEQPVRTYMDDLNDGKMGVFS